MVIRPHFLLLESDLVPCTWCGFITDTSSTATLVLVSERLRQLQWDSGITLVQAASEAARDALTTASETTYFGNTLFS